MCGHYFLQCLARINERIVTGVSHRLMAGGMYILYGPVGGGTTRCPLGRGRLSHRHGNRFMHRMPVGGDSRGSMGILTCTDLHCTWCHFPHIRSMALEHRGNCSNCIHRITTTVVVSSTYLYGTAGADTAFLYRHMDCYWHTTYMPRMFTTHLQESINRLKHNKPQPLLPAAAYCHI